MPAPSFVPTRSLPLLLATCLALFNGPVKAEGDMTFETVGGGGATLVNASGHITDSTPQVFSAFVRQYGRGRPLTIYLDSSGGTVLASMQLGTLIRQAGATVIVGKASAGFFGGPGVDKGECYSACVYTLIGGRRRIIPEGSEVGVHRMFLAIEGQGDVTRFAPQRERAMTGGIRALLTRYTSRMGVSTDLIARAEQTPSGSFYVLTPSDMRRWRLGLPN